MAIGKPGFYFVYREHLGPDGSERQLLGKFVILGIYLKVLEDHDGLSEVLPDGTLNSTILNRLRTLQNSPYFSVLSEQDIREGRIDDEMPILDPNTDPWTES